MRYMVTLTFRSEGEVCSPNHIYIYIYRERDLGTSGRIQAKILPTQTQSYDIQIQDPLCWRSTLFKVTKKQKLSVLNTFAHPSSRRKINGQNSILHRSTSLNIQMLDSTITAWSNHLKTLTHQFLLDFKYSITVKLTNSLCWPSILCLLDGWAKKIQNTWFFYFKFLEVM